MYAYVIPQKKLYSHNLQKRRFYCLIFIKFWTTTKKKFLEKTFNEGKEEVKLLSITEGIIIENLFLYS